MAAETESKEATKQIVCKPAIIQAPQMSSWNDKRLDELSARTDAGFKEVNQRLDRIDERFHRLYYLLVAAICSILGTGIL